MPDFTIHPDDDKVVMCHRCRQMMKSLARFQPEDVRFISDVNPHAETMTRVLGWRYFAGTFLLTFFETLYEFAASGWRRRKVARLKREILPRFPKSQICPRCLRVEKRA